MVMVVVAALAPPARCAPPRPVAAPRAQGPRPLRGPRREPRCRPPGLPLHLLRPRHRRRLPPRAVLKPRVSRGWCAWRPNYCCCLGCCCSRCTSRCCAVPEPPTGRTLLRPTPAGPSSRITSTWKLIPHQKPTFPSPKQQQGSNQTTRLHTNPSPDSDCTRSMGTLHCKEMAPDPFSLIYQTFRIFPKLISMDRIQISRSP